MRRSLRLLPFVVCLIAALGARAASAACGDGVLQPGEVCEASFGGDAACPGRCIQPPNLQQCQCAVLSQDFRDFAVIADLQARIGAGAAVTVGGVAVTKAAGYLSLASKASLPLSAQAIADRCRLLPETSIGRLFCNQEVILPGAFVNNGGPFRFTPPLTFATLPTFSASAPGATGVTVPAASTRYLAPGAYGLVMVDPGGTLILHGLNGTSGAGQYDFRALKVAGGGQLFADNPVLVKLAETLKVTGQSFVGPTPASPVQPGDIQISVGGRAAKLGRGALVEAHVFVPTGKIAVGRGTIAFGRFVAQKVVMQKSAVVQLAGGCGDGVKQATEMCDTSAPNGDAACPGKCIPGDAQGLGRIVLGEAGQCTCECATNADCNDQNACNGVETCDAGHCVLGSPPACDDNNPCTIDCNSATGCVTVAVADETSCDDGNECTRSDKCMTGVCEPGELRTCNDGNDCTADSCDPAHGCAHEDLATGLPCSDGNACTGADACIRGGCVGGASIDCNDLNPCTADTCDPLAGCEHDPVLNGVSCAGPSPCTALDICDAGLCTSGAAQLCSDSNPCTTDTCELEGNVGMQTASCNHTARPDFTSCGPNGLVCFNGICQ